MKRLLRIVAPHFVAGIVAINGRVVQTAPVLHYMLDWSEDGVRGYAAHRKWRVETWPS